MRKPLIVTTCVAAAGVVIAGLTPAVATAGDQTLKNDVRVVNSAAEAVPVVPQGVTQVTGTLQVDDADPLRVTTQGPVEVAPTAFDPVQRFRPMYLAPGDSHLTEVLVDVPAGRRFIAEHVSGQAVVSSNGWIKVNLHAEGQPGVIQMPMTPILGGSGPGGFISGEYSQQLTWYVDGPTRVTANVIRSDPEMAIATANPITLFGRLVDCPTCTAQS